jgi:hypothetical protein
MEDQDYTGLIPEQIEGAEITASASTEFQKAEEAGGFYQEAKQRLLFVQNWHELTGTPGADFELRDDKGNLVDQPAQKGNYFRIDITGPGSKAGEGYDWAIVEEIIEVNRGDVDSIAMRVRPAFNPQTPGSNIAHFYSEKSTSTFVITREGKKVMASIYDRNIESNEETKEPLDIVRNAVVGLGAKYVFSKMQWQALAEALVEKD